MTDASTIFDWLTQNFPGASKSTLRDMVSGKRVALNGSPVKSLKQAITRQDKVTVGEVARGKTATLAGNLKVIYEDPDILIIDKPPGLLTATHEEETRTTTVDLLADYVKKQGAKNRLRLIHRLDRDASGLLVFARTDAAFTSLKTQFFEHTIDRKYDVIVHKPLPVGQSRQLKHTLREDHLGIVHVTKDTKHGKLAVLDYSVVANNKTHAHLKCTLFTGRKHQIRVQLLATGHAVAGDVVYGTDAAKENREAPFRLALHASHLSFKHPRTNKEVSFDSSMPPAFQKLIAS